MRSRKYIFFVFICLTSCLSQSGSNTTASSNTGFNSKYYCEEFSVVPPATRNWRQLVLTELTREKFPLLFDPRPNSDLVKYCPNFPKLSDDQKKIIWLRVFDGMVFFESSCKTGAQAAGPNGTAFGLLQLHLGREQDYARDCKKNDSKSSQRSLACGIVMVHDQIDQNNKLFFDGSYWEVLRPRGRSQRAKQIASHLWYYPLCQPAPKQDAQQELPGSAPKPTNKPPVNGLQNIIRY